MIRCRRKRSPRSTRHAAFRDRARKREDGRGHSQLDLDDDTLTKYARRLSARYIDNSVPSGQGGIAQHRELTADAFGVLPRSRGIASAHVPLLSGYTAKVAGTEKGVNEPKATFSTCLGAPLWCCHPTCMPNFWREDWRHDAKVWLVNTGWPGGPYGIGSRMRSGTPAA